MASPCHLHGACAQGTRTGAAAVLETFFLNLLLVTFPLNFLVNTVVLLPIPVRRAAPPLPSPLSPLPSPLSPRSGEIEPALACR